jgi:hypothetical protein
VNIRPVALYQEVFGTHEDGNDYTTEVLLNDDVEKHADVIARILFIYAKLNPGVRYV